MPMQTNSTSALSQITASIQDAFARFNHPDFEVRSWQQQWGDSACGFGGLACQAFWMAQTVIAINSDHRTLVYHNGRFAYDVLMPTLTFREACHNRRLTGAREYSRGLFAYDASVNPTSPVPGKSAIA